MKPGSFLLFLLFSNFIMAQEFIRVEGAHFKKGDQRYYFLGTNFWQGMNLASKGFGGNRDRLLRELDRFEALGISNLRIMVASEGPDSEPWRMLPTLMPAPGQYNEDLLDGLDFLLAEMEQRNLHAVMCLGNFWAWSGGMAQYVNWVTNKAIPYHNPETGNWIKFSFYTAKFYKLPKAKALYREHIKTLINRKNAYTGKQYKDDPTIMAWQLCNEPRGMLYPRKYRKWIHETAALIKSLDPNHLVSLGSEGETPYPIGNKFRKDHSSKYIDYFTIHIWIENWGWYNPEKPEKTYAKGIRKARKYLEHHLKVAEAVGKPIVLEEFGIARDQGNHHPDASTEWRNRFYNSMFEMVLEKCRERTAMAGCNFWAWGGEGRPHHARAIWQKGHDFIGDPPHEYQGWYSIYEKDETTLQIIRSFTRQFQALTSSR